MDTTTDKASPPPSHGISEGRWARFAFFKTKRFWFILFLGQILALCITGTGTSSGLLAINGVSIPTFQNMFIYILLSLIYTPYTIYQYGLAKYYQMLKEHAWKYMILAFFDVIGNYFAVLSYRYTTILSQQLFNFWSIAVVVAVSFLFLKVRYHWAQIIGILIACGGMGVLMAADHKHNGSNVSGGANPVKGDIFALIGATAYGLSNVTEEFLVSQRPLYEVVGQLGIWGFIINGVIAAIFDRNQFRDSNWDSDAPIGGYIVAFTVCMLVFYSLAPVIFRMASAAFFNISLLTSNFWGLLIGTQVFGLILSYMYGIAFVCIVLGLLVLLRIE